MSTRLGAQTATISADGEIISDEVQVDIVSDGAAVSFTDEFAFEAHPNPITLF